MGPHFMLLMSIYVLYSNVSYMYPVSCLVETKLFQSYMIIFLWPQSFASILMLVLLYDYLPVASVFPVYSHVSPVI